MEMSDAKETRRSIVQSLPSDYSDVQPKNYDPEYISAISNKMQVPDSIPAVNSDSSGDNRRSGMWSEPIQSHHMNVPERIMLAGGGEHIGARPEIQNLNFDHIPMGGYPDPVGLQTPPRTLTLDEQFPTVEEEEQEEQTTPRNAHRIPNGNALVPQPYTPGMSASDSLLLNDEDEVTQLRTQVAKLSRRVTVIESEQGSRGSRETMIYTATFGYFMLKFLYWFFRNK